MTMRSWIRNVFTRPATRPIRKAPHRTPLGVEALEDRTVPATFTVLNIADSGPGSLREAVGLANSTAGPDTIDFDSSVFSSPQTITMLSTTAGGELTLSDAATTKITGPGQDLLSISGNTHMSGLFVVEPGASAELSGLTITDGRGFVTFGSGAIGGGLWNRGGTATLTDCTISGNVAPSGGGVANGEYSPYFPYYIPATTNLTNCTISGNSTNPSSFGGGGVINFAGTLTMTDCTVSGNSTSSGGSGVQNNYHGTLVMTDCTVSGNTGGSGAFYNFYGTASLTNCTISGNSAGSSSGTGGLMNFYGAATLTNTIVAGQTMGNDLSGTVSGSNNLIGGNPLLAPLGDYGGPTQTMPPLPGSPAINAGTSGAGIPATDQRGLGRVGAVDIGAVERQAPTITVPGAQTAYEDVDQLISGIRVSGDPQGNTPFTLTLAVGHGTLTFANTSGLTVTVTGSGSVSLSGSIDDINAALAGLVYRGSLNYSGPDRLDLNADDGNLNTLASVAIDVKSAAQQAADLQARVNSLRDAGELNRVQAGLLNAWLNLKGNRQDILRVTGFLVSLDVYRRLGILTQAEADALLDWGNLLLLSVTRR